MRFLLLSFSFLLSILSYAQEGVRTASKKEIAGKIMVIPFEPKLYMSEIDQKVNQETKWNFDQIREYFRHQLDNQLKLKLQSIESPVVTYYIDSAKTSKDLEYIYKSTTIAFDPMAAPTAPTAEVKKQSGIKNGQLVVEMGGDKKFTNTKFNNKELIPFLNKKYKSDYFVFINELDFRTVMDSYDLASDTYLRETTVHYTIVDSTSKLIAAGAASYRFSSKTNEPKKIVAATFSPIAAYIASKLEAVMKPKETK